MTKSLKNLLNRVLMMAWTIIVAHSYTLPVFAGPLDWLKRKTTETIEAGKDALELMRYGFHFDQFISETGFVTLLVGRSWAHCFCIVGVLFSVGLLSYRIRRDKSGDATFIMRLITAYAIAIGLGWGYELVRSFGSPKAEAIAKMGLLIVAATLVLAIVIHVPKPWILFRAMKAGTMPYFLKTLELQPAGLVVTPPASPVVSTEGDPASQQAPETRAPMTEAVSAPDPALTPASAPTPARAPAPPASPVIVPAPKPDKPYFRVCPSCHERIPANAKGCGFCGTVLKKAAVSTVACTACGKQIPASAKGCGFCGARTLLLRNDTTESEDPSLDWLDIAMRK